VPPNPSLSRTPIAWSWKIAEIADIAVYVHATFFLLVAWFGLAFWVELGSLTQMLSGVALLLSLFGCVLLHELGHALTARRFGVRTRQITLLPIGGIASLERSPDDPLQGLWITLAGPAVNLVIAIILLAVLLATGTWTPLHRVTLTEGPFLERLMIVNVSLLVFNMLPAFPMDGGRALRDLLATRLDEVRATRIAATLGQGMAALFAIIGWLANPMLLLIALFVWMGASQEAKIAEIRSALRGIPVARVMIEEFSTVAPDDRLADVVEVKLRGAQNDFPVVADGQVAGLLSRRDLLRGLADAGPASRVADAMARRVRTVSPHDSLDTVLDRLEADLGSAVLVTDTGQLKGLLTTDAVAAFLSIQAALHRRPGEDPSDARREALNARRPWSSSATRRDRRIG
jgi:Zn-dependent protease/CBS domain-containing protein